MLEVTIVAIAALFGMTSQRILGFGTSSFLVPALLIYFSAPTAVGVTLLIGSFMSFLVLYDGRHHWVLPWPVMLRLFIASIPGSLIGTYIVIHANKSVLQIVLGLLIIGGLYIQDNVFPKPSRKLRVGPGISASGFAAGLLGAIAAQAPPPLLLYIRSYIVTPEQVRQIMSVFFLLMNLVVIPTLLIVKPESLNGEAMKIFLLLVPVAFIATLLGRIVSNKLNTKQYHKIVYIAINATAIVTIILGIIGLR
jgi:uncharacterized membrane protein YfcA